MSSASHVPLSKVIEVISSGAPKSDRAVLEHLQKCEECRLVAEGYAALRKVVRNLPRPDPPEELHKQAVSLAATLAQDQIRRRRVNRMRIALSAILAGAVLAGFGGWQWTRTRTPSGIEAPTPAPPSRDSVVTPSPDSQRAPSPQPTFVSKGRIFDDAQRVRDALSSDPTVEAFRRYYKASDVGSNQRSMQMQLGELAGNVKGRTPAECMNVVLRGIPRPTLPAYVERARYNGRDAWLMVFVYSPDSQPDSALSGVIFYATAVEDCTFLATAFWA